MKRIIVFSSILIVFLFGILGADRLILITDPPEGNVFGVRSTGTTLHLAFQSDATVLCTSNDFFITVSGPIIANWVSGSLVILPYANDWGLWAWSFDNNALPQFSLSCISFSCWTSGDDILHPCFTVDIEWDYTGDVQIDTAEICINADYDNYWYWEAADAETNLNPSFNYGTAEDPNPWCIKVGPVLKCGDANGDDFVNVTDAVWIVNYVFVGGEAPAPYENGNVNCDSTINMSDAVWLINFIFLGGPAPCEC